MAKRKPAKIDRKDWPFIRVLIPPEFIGHMERIESGGVYSRGTLVRELLRRGIESYDREIGGNGQHGTATP